MDFENAVDAALSALQTFVLIVGPLGFSATSIYDGGK
jgi:hypothetical protein